MSKTLRAVIHDGKIEPLEQVDLPEGAKVLVTLLPDEESEFWLGASATSRDAIWANPEDDIYAQLLEG
jgi:predicted DNA-binding antitoxin AbrB/MazE fold protein